MLLVNSVSQIYMYIYNIYILYIYMHKDIHPTCMNGLLCNKLTWLKILWSSSWYCSESHVVLVGYSDTIGKENISSVAWDWGLPHLRECYIPFLILRGWNIWKRYILYARVMVCCTIDSKAWNGIATHQIFIGTHNDVISQPNAAQHLVAQQLCCS